MENRSRAVRVVFSEKSSLLFDVHDKIFFHIQPLDGPGREFFLEDEKKLGQAVLNCVVHGDVFYLAIDQEDDSKLYTFYHSGQNFSMDIFSMKVKGFTSCGDDLFFASGKKLFLCFKDDNVPFCLHTLDDTILSVDAYDEVLHCRMKNSVSILEGEKWRTWRQKV